MDPTRPPGLIGLGQARDCKKPSQALNIMGIVSDIMPVTKTTNDYMVTFEIQDPDLVVNASNRGLRARFFVSAASDLPPVKSVGDVILIRRCQIVEYKGAVFIKNIKGRTADSTSTVVFPAHSIPKEAFKQAYAGDKLLDCICQPAHLHPTKAEQMYAIELKEKVGSLLPSNPVLIPTGPNPNRAGPSNAASLPAEPVSSTFKIPEMRKFCLIKDARYDQFCDLIVQVVKIFDNKQYVELYVTDYTDNNLLFDYPSPDEKEDDSTFGRDGDPYAYMMPVRPKEWPGPYGQKTLMVELHSPHADFVSNKVNEGDLVMLQNVRIKSNGSNKMEGNMFRDNKFPDKIQVHLLRGNPDVYRGPTRSHLEHFVAKRRTYWKKVEQQLAAQSKKEKGAAQLKKERKKAKKGKDRVGSDEPASKRAKKDTDAGPLENNNVRCKNPDVGLSTLTDILSIDRSYKGPSGEVQTLPFINQQRKAKVRIVDFYPPTLEAFARPVENTVEPSEDVMVIDDLPSQKWEWDFFLLLEDLKSARPGEEPTQLWVHVAHEDAQFLLSIEEDATDLYHNAQTLKKLRETLFLLWGNLEEVKSAASKKNITYPPPPDSADGATEIPKLDNTPFECCLWEHGVEVENDEVDSQDSPKFLRAHSLFGTRIV